ncbi:hypothetical protein EVA_17007 [gut metagenome]|uniref:Uncharacterized protein n=1 Tax=gut metagenome TaxID=749906 RepID=J9G5U0_9ZZZZ
MTAIPVGSQRIGRTEIIERSEFLIVDTDIGTAAAERKRLQSEVKRLLVGTARYRENQYFSVAGVINRCHTVVALTREGYGAPATLCFLRISKAVHIIVASAPTTAADDDAAIGQFFGLGFVRSRGNGGNVSSAQYLPVYTEIVRIEHIVTHGVIDVTHQCGTVKAVMATHLRVAALVNLTRTDKHGTDGPTLGVVKLRIDAFCEIRRCRPSFTEVRTYKTSNALVMFARSVGERNVTRAAQHKYIVGFTVSYDTGVAKSRVKGVFGILALTFNNGRNVIPGFTLIVAHTGMKVNAAVGTTGKANVLA